MHAAVDRLYDEVPGRSVTGVVVTSAKKTFFAGGNLTLMMQATPDDARVGVRRDRGDQGRPAPAREAPAARSSPRSTAPPSAAASRSRWPANHRIVVDDPSAVVGLPEATLGLLPGGGGVTRDRPDARPPVRR